MKRTLFTFIVFFVCTFTVNYTQAFMSASPMKVGLVSIFAFNINGEKVLEKEFVPTKASIFLRIEQEKPTQLLLSFEEDSPKDISNFVISGDETEGRVEFSIPLGESQTKDFCGFSFVAKFYEGEIPQPNHILW